jgi:hypothetical protein
MGILDDSCMFGVIVDENQSSMNLLQPLFALITALDLCQ